MKTLFLVFQYDSDYGPEPSDYQYLCVETARIFKTEKAAEAYVKKQRSYYEIREIQCDV